MFYFFISCKEIFVFSKNSFSFKIWSQTGIFVIVTESLERHLLAVYINKKTSCKILCSRFQTNPAGLEFLVSETVWRILRSSRIRCSSLDPPGGELSNRITQKSYRMFLNFLFSSGSLCFGVWSLFGGIRRVSSPIC